MSDTLQSPFARHAGPVIDSVVEQFGARYGEQTVRDYATLFLGVNTCGQGVDPDDMQELMEHLTFTAESVTSTFEPLTDEPQENIEDEFLETNDTETRDSLLRDEELGMMLFGAFKTLWPEGRATVLSD